MEVNFKFSIYSLYLVTYCKKQNWILNINIKADKKTSLKTFTTKGCEETHNSTIITKFGECDRYWYYIYYLLKSWWRSYSNCPLYLVTHVNGRVNNSNIRLLKKHVYTYSRRNEKIMFKVLNRYLGLLKSYLGVSQLIL